MKKANIQFKEPKFPKQLDLMIIGDSGVGKSTMLDHLLVEADDRQGVRPTESVDIKFYKTIVAKKLVNVPP